MKKKRLFCLYNDEDINFFVYYPTIFSPLYCKFETMTFSRRVRLMLEYFSKGSYQVYYIGVGNSLVGYCVVAPGNRRLKKSRDIDIVLGPYYIREEYRGLGYAKKLIDLTLKESKFEYIYAYDYIKKDNISSIRATLSNGFVQCGELDIVGFFHTLVERDGGEYNIYVYPQRD